MESYVDHVTIVKHGVALTRLRVSCHNLEIEVGRYHRPRVTALHQHVCQTCQVLEDECILYVCAQDSLLYGWSSSLLSLFIIVHLPYSVFIIIQISSFIY